MKMIKQDQNVAESFLSGALLAIVGGFLDVYTYILRGHVFANAQTGNIVLLALNLAEGCFSKVLYHFIPILTCMIGVIIAQIIKNRFSDDSRIHWQQIIVISEIIILGIISFIPSGRLDIVVIVSIAFICSMQMQGFKKMNGNAFATIFCTGNLRNAAEYFYTFILTKNINIRNTSFQYCAIIIFFIIGAISGALLTKVFLEKSLLFCCIPLMAEFTLIKKPKIDKEVLECKKERVSQIN